MYLVERFVRKNCDSTYCNFLNIKLRHGYFSANITKFSEQVSLKHLQEHNILLTGKSEHMINWATSNHYNLNIFLEMNYKKQTHLFFILHIVEIYCNFI